MWMMLLWVWVIASSVISAVGLLALLVGWLLARQDTEPKRPSQPPTPSLCPDYVERPA
jgi:hypothetical protein